MVNIPGFLRGAKVQNCTTKSQLGVVSICCDITQKPVSGLLWDAKIPKTWLCVFSPEPARVWAQPGLSHKERSTMIALGVGWSWSSLPFSDGFCLSRVIRRWHPDFCYPHHRSYLHVLLLRRRWAVTERRSVFRAANLPAALLIPPPLLKAIDWIHWEAKDAAVRRHGGGSRARSAWFSVAMKHLIN